jgi:pyridoxamine 5'-phosphate oxidase
MSSIAELRREYALAGLNRSDLADDPVQQFQNWFAQAVEAEVSEPNAMALATVDKNGQPSARFVLLKGIDERGFLFFTNHESRKGRELAENPQVSLVFYWGAVERQVSVTGTASKLSREESEAYFRTRPRGSRLGAWASRQSQSIANREILENRLKELEAQYPGDNIPMPDCWGGYVVAPKQIEFWQGRPNRLHDRFCYTRSSSGLWQIERLSP